MPIPSKPSKPDDGSGLALSVMPVLLNVDDRLGAGTLTWAALIKVRPAS